MSKAMTWLTLMLVPIFFPAAAQAKVGRDAQIREADAQFRRAMVSGDVRQMDRIVAADARIIHGGNGAVQDKKGLIDRFRSYHIETYDRTPLILKVDSDLAVLVSTTRKIAGGHQTDTSTTEVFVRRSGRWQLLVLQNTDHTAG